jgi:hypothetical protein
MEQIPDGNPHLKQIPDEVHIRTGKKFFLFSFQVADSRWESTCGADARWESTSEADSRWNPHLNWKMKFDPKRLHMPQ